jgi:hypothetical protein
VCYALYLATPLTLSEVRSMLPAGLGADSLTRSEAAPLLTLDHDVVHAARAVRLLRGACACDLVLERDAARSDERRLRERYFALGRPRDEVIRLLERHRQGAAARPRPRRHWTEALAGFVAEHARNAGPSIFLLHFGPALPAPRPDASVATVTVPAVLAHPETWLVEDVPTLVVR